MIDIHCHLLPGIDDGPTQMGTSIDMCRMAVKDGISHIVATPHYRCQDIPTVQDIREKVGLLQEEIRKNNIPLQLSMGADIRLTYELLQCMEQKALPSINGSRYFLLELPDLLPPHFDNLIFEAKIKGYIPIITHPERNYSLLASPEKTAIVRESGALIQLTAMSITGDFGKPIRRYSYALLEADAVDFVASDAHNTDRRVPVLSRAYRVVASEFGQETADRLFIHNPKAVVENRELI